MSSGTKRPRVVCRSKFNGYVLQAGLMSLVLEILLGYLESNLYNTVMDLGV